ncbi:MAG: hypothetical protein GXP32_02320, partial [Kiritimatiellaeota bacterium]|nr:hypothetical protein [Kiritimatiellota bacterium]
MEDKLTFIPKAVNSKINYTLNPKWRPFPEAREYARNLNLKSVSEWDDFAKGEIPGLKRPEDIPYAPQQFYKYQGWAGYVDWLGLKRKKKRNFHHFNIARNFVQSLQLESRVQWTLYCKGKFTGKGIKPGNIPAS